MILHYAHLCAAAGGVDAFLIGSEMRGLTTIRERRRELSGGAGLPRPGGGRPRDPRARRRRSATPPTGRSTSATSRRRRQRRRLLPSRPALGRRRTSTSSASTTTCRSRTGATAASTPTPRRAGRRSTTAPICSRTSPAARASTGSMPAPPIARRRCARPITDGAAGKPWVFRYKDLRAWWSNPHFDRPGGVESGTPTAWVPQGKPIWFTELGCPAVDRGTNQPNVFFDPKSSESFLPYFSRGWRDDAIQRAYLEATYLYWGEAANNPISTVYGGPDGRGPRMRRLDLGRAPLSVLPRAGRGLDRRAELAARALADRAARRGRARSARAPSLPPRGAARGPDRRLRPLGRGRGL